MFSALLLTSILSASPSLVVGEVHAGRLEPARAFFLREGEHLAIDAAILEGSRCFSAAPLRLREMDCQTLPPGVLETVRWSLARPLPGDYDNQRACGGDVRRGCHDPIRYSVEDLEALRGRLHLEPRELLSVGTHRMALRLRYEGHELSIPGAFVTAIDDQLAAGTIEIVVRRDDTYVGMLTELLGAPFALGPNWLPGLGHQTDRRLAADCVALVIYGQRRMGRTVPYMAPSLLQKRLQLVGSAAELVDGDGSVADVGRVQPGDVLHFGFQTAVLSRDLPPLGKLSLDDLVIQTYHGVAEELPLGQLPYRRHSVEVLRWPPPSRAGAIH